MREGSNASNQHIYESCNADHTGARLLGTWVHGSLSDRDGRRTGEAAKTTSREQDGVRGTVVRRGPRKPGGLSCRGSGENHAGRFREFEPWGLAGRGGPPYGQCSRSKADARILLLNRATIKIAAIQQREAVKTVCENWRRHARHHFCGSYHRFLFNFSCLCEVLRSNSLRMNIYEC